MTELDQLYTQMLVNISERYSQTSEFIEQIMDRIAYHESKRDPECHQMGGGPGRGLFQFELGQNEGGETAMNRLLRWFKANQADAPDWTSISTKNGVDASKLPLLGQNMLFMGNVRYHPKASFKDLTYKSLPVWWANYHWAGPKAQAEARIKSFHTSMNYYPGVVI